MALNPGGVIGFAVCNNGSCPSGSGSVSTAVTLPANQWTHLAVTYDGSYLTNFTSMGFESLAAYNQGIFPGTSPLVIGAATSGGPLHSPG